MVAIVPDKRFEKTPKLVRWNASMKIEVSITNVAEPTRNHLV